MTNIGDITLSKLSARIEKIQQKIEHVNSVTDEAISQLESQKRGLRSSFHPRYPILEKNIQDITLGHDKIIEKLLQEQANVRERKASLDQLDFTVCQLDREISRLQAERDQHIFDLNKKREDILKALKKTESLFSQIRQLDNQIGVLMETHQAEIEQLQTEKEEVMNRTDLDEGEKQVLLAELDRKIQDEEEAYKEYMSSLERQKNESLYMLKQYTDEETKAFVNAMKNDLNDLEASKVGASPSEIEIINRKITELKTRVDEVEMITDFRERGLSITRSGHIVTESGEIYTMEEAANTGMLEGMDITKLLVRDKLKEKGVSLSKSGVLRTKSGRTLTLKEARVLGIGDSLMDTIQMLSTKKSSLSAPSETRSDMSSEDINYLKTTVGKPLTIALAEICMKQPRDPIHYLGHWLFKYRYNQEVDDVKKREVEELIAERERLRMESWHKEMEDAARSAVLEMVFKAHDEAMQHELDLEAHMKNAGGEEEENDELAEEAKDVLGEYTGPPVGQRRI